MPYPAYEGVGSIVLLVSVSFQRVTGDLIKRVNNYISVPLNQDQLQNIKRELYDIAGFPRVMGAIDCTHVQLHAATQNRHLYINGKETYSVNVKVVFDANNCITNVYANYPGSAHDSFILANSQVAAAFQRDDSLRGWLIGDNGYPLMRWLLTLLFNPTTRTEPEESTPILLNVLSEHLESSKCDSNVWMSLRKHYSTLLRRLAISSWLLVFYIT